MTSNVHGAGPVSYTHLDVYKRQANDYAITLPLDDVQADAPLLAFLMDGQPMSLRDKGPVWMVYPYCLLYTSRCV